MVLRRQAGLARRPRFLLRPLADPDRLELGLGLAGRSALATLWLASGRPLPAALTAALLDDARAAIAASALADDAGVSAQDPRLLVLRALAPRVEPALQLLQSVWGTWRRLAWQLAPCPPRVWRT